MFESTFQSRVTQSAEGWVLFELPSPDKLITRVSILQLAEEKKSFQFSIVFLLDELPLPNFLSHSLKENGRIYIFLKRI